MARVHAPRLIPDPLLLGVLVLLVVFRSSEQLAIVYGLTVTGTFLLTTMPFLVYAHPNTVSTPLALSENAQFNRVIHEKVFIAHGSRQRPAHGTSGRSHGGSHGCGVRSHHPVDPALRVPGRPGRPRRPADRA
ncbi:KUP/HAK/KT family potassium transporter [Kocuria marina]|uniref:KUP/HAK/KT family potassium transporter n=1 Tax=Kocuria marina TaxID=223184 RepID=UPI0022DEF588|nr:KUP/HAK/KT family potassium transporter [Kocuria marina]